MDFVNSVTPPLVIEYKGSSSEPTNPAIDAVLIIALPCGLDVPLSARASAAILVPSHTPVIFTDANRFQSSSDTSEKSLPRNSPALFAKISNPPKDDLARFTALSQSSSIVTSKWIKLAFGPSFSANSCPCFSIMSPIITFAPASIISFAVAAPMPRPAPEISAIFPSRRFNFLLL